MSNQLLTTREDAVRLKVSRETVVAWIRRGRIRGGKFGKSWRVLESDLQAFIGETIGDTIATARDDSLEREAELAMAEFHARWGPKGGRGHRHG